MIDGNSVANTDCGKSELGEVLMGEDRTAACATEEWVLENTCTHTQKLMYH